MTANVTTLNQIVRNLQEIADKHYQINEFQFGDPWEFYTSGIAVTPVMWVRVDPSEVTRNTVKYKFTVWLLDSVKRGEINETEVLSDMFQVATDVIAQLRSPDYNWSFDYETTTITPVTEHSPYAITGVYFNVSIKLLYPGDTCRIPFTNSPNIYPLT